LKAKVKKNDTTHKRHLIYLFIIIRENLFWGLYYFTKNRSKRT